MLTVANPLTILSFVAVFTGLELVETGRNYPAAALVAGVFAGSAMWCLLLSGVAGWLRGRSPTGCSGLTVYRDCSCWW